MHDALARQARKLGIDLRITWCGSLAQDELLPKLRSADLFALACRVASDGDRDGLPNVLVEAQSQSLACVATRVSAIPELIRDGLTGVLVEPEAPEALARALQTLITDPARRAVLGSAGRARVAAEFSLDGNFERLAEKFGLVRVDAPFMRVASR